MDITNTLRLRLRQDERGFTFVEVLVVTIIIGILAAIALALLLGEREKAHDAGIKSDVAGISTEVESCHTEEGDFRECDHRSKYDDPDEAFAGLPVDNSVTAADTCNPGATVDPAVGTVAVVGAMENCFVIKGVSEADNGDPGAQHVFVNVRNENGTRDRTCGPGQIQGFGGCPSSGRW